MLCITMHRYVMTEEAKALAADILAFDVLICMKRIASYITCTASEAIPLGVERPD